MQNVASFSTWAAQTNKKKNKNSKIKI